jgi:hypothetical protein
MFIAAHFQNLETELSYRVRMTEALWGRLPIVCDSGDVVSDIIKENELGIVLKESSPKETARMIAGLTDKDKMQFRKNIEKFIKTQTWESLITPLDDHSKQKFFPYDLIDDRRELSLMQRKIIDEKEGIIRDLENGIKAINNRFSDQLNMQAEENKRLNAVLSEMNESNRILMKRLSDADQAILDISTINEAKTNELAEIKNRLFETNLKNMDLEETVTKQRITLGKFRASIVFNFYRITSTIGETRIGKVLQRIIK